MVDCAAQIDARLTADELLKLLSNPDEEVRLRACKRLARLKDPRAIPYLRSMPKAPKHWMRRIAIGALGDFRDEGSVERSSLILSHIGHSF
jgi:HEAT repeat protein